MEKVTKKHSKALQDYIISRYGTGVFYDPEGDIFDTVEGWTDFYLSMLNSPEAREDDKLNGYNGDAWAWFLDCIRYDTLKPVKAIISFSVYEGDKRYNLAVDYSYSYDKAINFCEQWGWFYDDCFTACRSRGLEVWDVSGEPEPDAWYCANSDVWYSAARWSKWLYK